MTEEIALQIIAKQHLRSSIQALAGGVDNCAQRRNYGG